VNIPINPFLNIYFKYVLVVFTLYKKNHKIAPITNLTNDECVKQKLKRGKYK
jgi:hypothetical protein